MHDLWPLLLAVALAVFMRWVQRRRGGAPLVDLRSRTRQVAFMVVMTVVLILAMGATNDWRMESTLMPLGWLATGAVVALIARWILRKRNQDA